MSSAAKSATKYRRVTKRDTRSVIQHEWTVAARVVQATGGAGWPQAGIASATSRGATESASRSRTDQIDISALLDHS
jgi:hypothetical protein